VPIRQKLKGLEEWSAVDLLGILIFLENASNKDDNKERVRRNFAKDGVVKGGGKRKFEAFVVESLPFSPLLLFPRHAVVGDGDGQGGSLQLEQR
jgi:hypothetical protein